MKFKNTCIVTESDILPAIDMLWQNFRSPEFGPKFQREVSLFLKVPEFPYNTV